MRDALRSLLLSMLVLWSLGSAANAAEFDNGQRQEIETVVRDYLLSHPEILQEMAQTLEQRQKQAEDEQRNDALVKNADQIFRDKSDYVAGNPKGNVTMVEFFDYNCPWCKKDFPDVMALIDEDKELKVVLKEFPILRSQILSMPPRPQLPLASKENTCRCTRPFISMKEKLRKRSSTKLQLPRA